MRKTGKNHSHLALKPLGIKDSTYELSARAALLACNANVHTEQHLVDIYVLADLCEAINGARNKEQYIYAHASTVKRILGDIHGTHCKRSDYIPLETSVHLLLEWFHKQPNSIIARIAMQQVTRYKKEH